MAYHCFGVIYKQPLRVKEDWETLTIDLDSHPPFCLFTLTVGTVIPFSQVINLIWKFSFEKTKTDVWEGGE